MKNFNFPNQEDDINFYNTEKYSQALEPKSESERKLWPQLEGAERPIKNILKRINRLSLDKFPEAQFITMGSCSSHSTKDGKLIEFGVENSTTPDILFEIKVKHEAITDENNEEWDNIEDLDTNNSEKFIGFFRSLFNSAVEQVNKKFNGEVIRFGYIDRKNGGNFINKEFISPEPVLVYTPKEEKTYYSYNYSGLVCQNNFGGIKKLILPG